MNFVTRIALGAPLLYAAISLTQAAPDDHAEKTPPLVEALAKATFVGQTPDEAQAQLEGKKIIGLYFTAKWCAPCRAFTPKLVKFRNAHAEDFQFVMMSWDKSLEAQEQYLEKAQMKVPAVRFDDPLIKAVGQQFRVRGVPTLLIFDAKGAFITDAGREHLTLPIYPDDMAALGKEKGTKTWRELVGPLQEEHRAARDVELAELAPVFEKYKHFPQLDAIRAVYGYFGKSGEIDKAMTRLGREIADDWEGKKGLLDELPMLAKELKPQKKGYRGVLETRSGRCFDELGKAAAENPAILAKLFSMIEGKGGSEQSWALGGIVNAAVGGSDEAFKKIVDYQSLRVGNAPLSIFPALKDACREENPRALDLAHQVYLKEPYYVYVAFPALMPPAYKGNEKALDVMAEIVHCGKPNYETAAREVLSSAAEEGSEHARKLLEGLDEGGDDGGKKPSK